MVVSDEGGQSPVVMTFALTAFLSFLLLATQMLVHLTALSSASSAAADAARRAASAGGSCAAGEAHAEQLLGPWASDLEIACRRDLEATVVQITGPSPARIVNAAGELVGAGRVDRSVRVPNEASS